MARVTGSEIIIAATRQARAMLCKADEINFLAGPGRGVILIKLQKEDDRLLGFIASTGDRDLMTVETTRGAEQTISTAKYGVTGRGGKGRELLQRGQFVRVVPRPSSNKISPSSLPRRNAMRDSIGLIVLVCAVLVAVAVRASGRPDSAAAQARGAAVAAPTNLQVLPKDLTSSRSSTFCGVP